MGTPELPVANLLLDMFEAADKDKNGTLDRAEFAAMLRSQRGGLTDKQIRRMLAECDQNEDGVISYREFVPMMVDQIATDATVEASLEASDFMKDLAQGVVVISMLYGLDSKELEAELLLIFRAADKSKTGKLSRHEFRKCLKAMKIGLSNKDINLLMSYADVDNDNQISYEEFAALAFDLMVKRVTDFILTTNTLQSDDALVSYLVCRFEEADKSKEGELAPRTVSAILRSVSEDVYPMSTYQRLAMMEVAPYTKSRKIDYIAFAPIVAGAMYGMITGGAYAQRLFGALKAASDDAAFKALSKLGVDKVRALLTDAYSKLDAEKNGKLTRKQVKEGLNEVAKSAVGVEPNLEPFGWAALEATAQAVGDDIPIDKVVQLLCNVVAYIGREEAINERKAQGKTVKAPIDKDEKAGDPAGGLSVEALAAADAPGGANVQDAPMPVA